MGLHIFKDLTQLQQMLQQKDSEKAFEKLDTIHSRLENNMYPDINADTNLEYIKAGLSSIDRDIGEEWGRATKLVYLVLLDVEKILRENCNQDLDMKITENIDSHGKPSDVGLQDKLRNPDLGDN